MKSIPLFPEQASNFAVDIDRLYLLLVALTLLFSLLVFVPVTYFLVKYRLGSKADRSNPKHHHLRLEIAWSIIPLLLAIPVFVWAAKLYVDMYTPLQSKSALEIYVVGKQWMWHLQHPTGQRENNELHIPVGRPIKLTMISQDVIHSFYVPAFRVKKDVLPGRYTSQWFIPTKTGRYHLFCAEFCGTKHSEMTGYVTVLEPEEYEKWLRDARWGIGSGGAAETMEQAGARLYVQRGCNGCHDPDRKKAPPFAGTFGTERRLRDGRTVVADEAYIRRSIFDPGANKVAGYEPIMPAFPDLGEQEVLQLIAYIKSLKDEKTTEGSQ